MCGVLSLGTLSITGVSALPFFIPTFRGFPHFNTLIIYNDFNDFSIPLWGLVPHVVFFPFLSQIPPPPPSHRPTYLNQPRYISTRRTFCLTPILKSISWSSKRFFTLIGPTLACWSIKSNRLMDSYNIHGSMVVDVEPTVTMFGTRRRLVSSYHHAAHRLLLTWVPLTINLSLLSLAFLLK
jgi:hypothetical protein